jgi:hypothetical protein
MLHIIRRYAIFKVTVNFWFNSALNCLPWNISWYVIQCVRCICDASSFTFTILHADYVCCSVSTGWNTLSNLLWRNSQILPEIFQIPLHVVASQGFSQVFSVTFFFCQINISNVRKYQSLLTVFFLIIQLKSFSFSESYWWTSSLIIMMHLKIVSLSVLVSLPFWWYYLFWPFSSFSYLL